MLLQKFSFFDFEKINFSFPKKENLRDSFFFFIKDKYESLYT